MRADGDHDVSEVNGCDLSSPGIVPLNKGLLRMLQLYFLQTKKVKYFIYVSHLLPMTAQFQIGVKKYIHYILIY